MNPDAGNTMQGGGENVAPPNAPSFPIAGQIPNLTDMPTPPSIPSPFN